MPIVALIMGLGFGGAQMMPWIIFPDTVDVAEMATGKRPTGTYSGMMTLARKIGGALGVGFVGLVVGWAGYKENTTGDPSIYIPQSESVLTTVKVIMGVSIAVFIAIALFASFRYKITTKKLERIRYFIDARKSGQVLTDEETQEREALIAELYGKVNPNDVVDEKELLAVQAENENQDEAFEVAESTDAADDNNNKSNEVAEGVDAAFEVVDNVENENDEVEIIDSNVDESAINIEENNNSI